MKPLVSNFVQVLTPENLLKLQNWVKGAFETLAKLFKSATQFVTDIFKSTEEKYADAVSMMDQLGEGISNHSQAIHTLQRKCGFAQDDQVREDCNDSIVQQQALIETKRTEKRSLQTRLDQLEAKLESASSEL